MLGPHRPYQLHPGHTGRGNPAARPRGQAAGAGTAPDTRRPSQRWKASPPGDGPPPSPRHAAPTGHASQGDSAGPPHLHTRAHSTWLADPDSPPRGRAARGGGAPGLRRPSQRRKGAPPGTPFCYPRNAQQWLPKAHAVGPVLGSARPHRRHPGHTGRGPPAARRRGRAAGGATALHTRRPSRRWKATPSRGRPPRTPRHAAPHRACEPRGQCWAPTPAHPRPQHAAGGPRQPAQRAGSWGRGSASPQTPLTTAQGCPPGNALPPPPQRAPVGLVLGPHADTNRTRDTRVAEPRLPAPKDERPGEGQRLTPDARPSQQWKARPPRGRPPTTPAASRPRQGMQAKRTVLAPHTRTPAPTAHG